MNRCKWCNINNPKYIDYHDNEWGKLKTDDNYLFEMLILETFQIGLSWECVLNKREAFKHFSFLRYERFMKNIAKLSIFRGILLLSFFIIYTPPVLVF